MNKVYLLEEKIRILKENFETHDPKIIKKLNDTRKEFLEEIEKQIKEAGTKHLPRYSFPNHIYIAPYPYYPNYYDDIFPYKVTCTGDTNEK